MATGYTLITGRPQAVLLHAASRAAEHGIHGRHAERKLPMVVMSGESQTAREDPALDIEQQCMAASPWAARALRRAGAKWRRRRDQPPYAL